MMMGMSRFFAGHFCHTVIVDFKASAVLRTKQFLWMGHRAVQR